MQNICVISVQITKKGQIITYYGQDGNLGTVRIVYPTGAEEYITTDFQSQEYVEEFNEFLRNKNFETNAENSELIRDVYYLRKSGQKETELVSKYLPSGVQEYLITNPYTVVNYSTSQLAEMTEKIKVKALEQYSYYSDDGLYVQDTLKIRTSLFYPCCLKITGKAQSEYSVNTFSFQKSGDKCSISGEGTIGGQKKSFITNEYSFVLLNANYTKDCNKLYLQVSVGNVKEIFENIQEDGTIEIEYFGKMKLYPVKKEIKKKKTLPMKPTQIYFQGNTSGFPRGLVIQDLNDSFFLLDVYC